MFGLFVFLVASLGACMALGAVVVAWRARRARSGLTRRELTRVRELVARYRGTTRPRVPAPRTSPDTATGADARPASPGARTSARDELTRARAGAAGAGRPGGRDATAAGSQRGRGRDQHGPDQTGHYGSNRTDRPEGTNVPNRTNRTR